MLLRKFQLPFSDNSQKSTENRCVEALESYVSKRRKRRISTTIKYIQYFPSCPEQVFIWSEGDEEIRTLGERFSFMFPRRLLLVDPTQWLQVCAAYDNAYNLAVPCWARVKSGLYRDDLALVETSYSTGFVDVLIVPRIEKGGRKRPPAALLTESKCKQLWPTTTIVEDKSNPKWFMVRKMLIKHGLLCLYIPRSKLTMSQPKSTRELSLFLESTVNGNSQHRAFVTNSLDSIVNSDAATVYCLGDRVKVQCGAHIGVEGVIAYADCNGGILLTPTGDNTESGTCSTGLQLLLTSSQVRRVFRVGDHVRVKHGRDQGQTGIIVEVNMPLVTFSTSSSHSTSPDVRSSLVSGCIVDFVLLTDICRLSYLRATWSSILPPLRGNRKTLTVQKRNSTISQPLWDSALKSLVGHPEVHEDMRMAGTTMASK